MRRQLVLAAAAACAFVIGSVGAASAQAATGATGPCGTLSQTAVNYTHVIWIMEENHSYGDIIGNTSQAPYINGLAGECGLATNYHNISHPSLPNYVAMSSGLAATALKPFNSDCNPTKKCSMSAASIFSQTSSRRAYEESMPSNCFPANSGEYAVRHNPPPYFTNLSNCATNDVPYTQFSSDLAGANLPAFSFITPNLIDDMHDGTIQDGDNWLQANLPAILNSAQYQAGTVAVFITWDEGSGGKTGENCATNTTDTSCNVATLVVSPSTTPGTQSSTPFNHYSLLGTTEQLLALPLLGSATGAGSLLSPFGL
jgi:phospholipase C